MVTVANSGSAADRGLMPFMPPGVPPQGLTETQQVSCLQSITGYWQQGLECLWGSIGKSARRARTQVNSRFHSPPAAHSYRSRTAHSTAVQDTLAVGMSPYNRRKHFDASGHR